MKKILIIAGGIVAKHFLERVIFGPSTDNLYTVVYDKEETLPNICPENLKFYQIDPTSYSKLSNILNEDFYQVMILLEDRFDAVETMANVKNIKKDMQIIFLDHWGIDKNNQNQYTQIVSVKDILTSRCFDYLPDVPVVAQNVGLGSGEIMEIRIPFGSSYVYRHLIAIEQKRWRISAIFRQNSLILPRPTVMLQPNDIILAIGDPNVLKSVYRSIKSEYGQFPLPYGNNAYVLIDMSSYAQWQIDLLIENTLFLFNKLNCKKLFIKIIKPTTPQSLDGIKKLESQKINIEIDYSSTDFEVVIKKDVSKFNIGLIVSEGKFFEMYKKTLHSLKLPVMKTTFAKASNLKKGVILPTLEKNKEAESHSSVIMDFSSQIKIDIELNIFNFSGDEEDSFNEIIEHYENLSKMFTKKLFIKKNEKNPLVELNKESDMIQFISFSDKIVQTDIFSYFSRDLEKLYFKLNNVYQLFIPEQI